MPLDGECYEEGDLASGVCFPIAILSHGRSWSKRLRLRVARRACMATRHPEALRWRLQSANIYGRLGKNGTNGERSQGDGDTPKQVVKIAQTTSYQ